MATNGDTQPKSPATKDTTPNPRESQQYVDPPPYHPPKPSKKTEEALIASVARYQAEAERREREKAQAAAMKNGTSNGTNGHESEDKPAKADTPHQ